GGFSPTGTGCLPLTGLVTGRGADFRRREYRFRGFLLTATSSGSRPRERRARNSLSFHSAIGLDPFSSASSLSSGNGAIHGLPTRAPRSGTSLMLSALDISASIQPA